MTTADSPVPAAKNIGLAMAAVTFDAMRPSLAELAGATFADSTKSLGSIVLQQINLLDFKSAVAAAVPTPDVSKLLAEHFTPAGGVLAPALSQLYGARYLAEANVDLQKAIAEFARSFTGSVTNANVVGLLQQAAAVRDDIEHQEEIDELTAEFLEGQPALAESIEQLPFLVNLSSAERQLVVWFIGIVVTIYVTMGLVNISLDNPDLGTLLGNLSLSGPAVGGAAGTATKKLLDKLPLAEDE